MNLDIEYDEVPPYEEWGWQELRAEAKVRGLPATGTKRDLAGLLWDYDEENPEPEPEAEPLREPERIVKVIPVSPAEETPAPTPQPPERRTGLFRREYPVPAEGFTDEFHRECLLSIHAEAIREGLFPRGGPYGANRVGWGEANGVKTAVYEDYVG